MVVRHTERPAGPGPSAGVITAAGPLVVSGVNPRYFTVGPGQALDERAVYLTGSHVWNNLQDGVAGGHSSGGLGPIDFDAYLRVLQERGHNFIRMWRWEHFASRAFAMTPQPWPRTGPGAAADGQPKFDLSAFDPVYFERLRRRLLAAGERGIYVSVMLFDGFGLHLTGAPENVEGHPFHAANNVNGIGITSLADYQVLPLDARIRGLQEAYLSKIVETVHDLPHVLFEVANESSGGGTVSPLLAGALALDRTRLDTGDSTSWQYWVMDFVRHCEDQRGVPRHPVGMSMQYPVATPARANDPLFYGPADWVSPGGGASLFDDRSFAERWYEDPPPNDGRKVVISDTDHYAPDRCDPVWAWKSFLRGHNPVLMDAGLKHGSPGPGDPFEAVRLAMGDTRRFAQRMNLLAMQPHGELSSTGYVLASPGEEYLVLQPLDAAIGFTLELRAGIYSAEWYSVATRKEKRASAVGARADRVGSFRPPFAQPGPVVLHLKRVRSL